MKMKDRESNDDDREVLAGVLAALEPYGPPPMGGILDANEGFYFGYLPPNWPMHLVEDDSPLNESIAVIRTIDMDLVRNPRDGQMIQVRFIVAGVSADRAEEAERRMRALVARARKDVARLGFQE